MKRIVLMAILAATACTPIVWDRPMNTPEQFAMDRARCQLTANASVPIVYGRNTSDAIADGIFEGIDRAQNFKLCMAANGYQQRAVR